MEAADSDPEAGMSEGSGTRGVEGHLGSVKAPRRKRGEEGREEVDSGK